MIFRREPALWLGLIGAFLTTLVSLNVSFLDAGAAAAIMVLLTSIVTAFLTRPVAPALFVGVLTALVALFAEYGLNISDTVVASLSSLLLAAFALFGIRPQVRPAEPGGEPLAAGLTSTRPADPVL